MPINRKSLKGPDRFQAYFRQLFDRITQSRKAIFSILGATVVIIIFGLVYLQHQEEQKHQATEELYLAREKLEKAQSSSSGEASSLQEKLKKQQKQKEEATSSDSKQVQGKEGASLSSQQRKQKKKEALQKLQRVANQYDGTMASYEASVELGRYYFKNGENKKAKKWFQRANQRAPSSVENVLTLQSLGSAYENLKKWDKAIDVYQKALSQASGMDDDYLKGYFLLSLARCFRAQNQVKQAKSHYQKVIDQLPDSEHAKTAKLFRQRLNREETGS